MKDNLTVGHCSQLTTNRPDTYINGLNKSCTIINNLLKIIELAIKEGGDIPYSYIEDYKNARTFLGYSNEHINL